jgi:hypothetical protein
MHNHSVCLIEISLCETHEHAANVSGLIPVALEASLHVDHHFYLHLFGDLKSADQKFLLQISIIHILFGLTFWVVPSIDGFKEVAFGQRVVLAVPGTMTGGTPAASGHRVIR